MNHGWVEGSGKRLLTAVDVKFSPLLPLSQRSWRAHESGKNASPYWSTLGGALQTRDSYPHLRVIRMLLVIECDGARALQIRRSFLF